MKSIPLIFLFCVSCFVANAQNIETGSEKIPGPDRIQQAIDEFNRIKRENQEKSNEVTVVLEPPEAPAPRALVVEDKTDNQTEAEGLEEANDKAPVLVNGKPPAPKEDDIQEPEGTTEAEEEFAQNTGDPSDQEALPQPEEKEPGLEIQVKSIRKGSGRIDPKLVKLRASFPVKPLTQVPDGWKLSPSENAPSFSRDVELQPGTVISLDITPHVISPDADGLDTFSISEPGYDSQLGYQQENTVGAILGESIAQLDEDSLKMGNALSDLHRLLASLPKPEELPEKP